MSRWPWLQQALPWACALAFAAAIFLFGDKNTLESGHGRRLIINSNYNDVPTLGDFNWADYLALIFMGLCLALASSGGVGGGPMLVPILAIFLNFPLKRATPMSNVIILGGGISNCAFNIMRVHPNNPNRPVIDFELSITLVPAVVGGTVAGVFLSTILPSWIVAILMVVILGFSAYKTINKGKTIRKKEIAAKEKAKAKAKAAAVVDAESGSTATSAAAESDTQAPASAVIANGNGNTSVNGNGNTSVNGNGNGSVTVVTSAGQETAVVEKKKGEFAGMVERTPWGHVAYLLAAYGGIVALAVGGNAIGCSSAGYWTLYWVELAWAFSFSIAAMVHVQRSHTRKISEGHQFVSGDVVFTVRRGAKFLLQCAFAGLVAGLFGIGGGVFIGPLLVEMKVLPQVASATTAVLVLFAAASAVVKFFLISAIPSSSYTLLLFLMGLVITFVAQKLIMGYVRRSGAASIIVLSIGISIALGSILMAFLAVTLTVKDAGNGLNIKWCGGG